MTIKGKKGEAPSGGVESPNTLQSNSLYKVVDLICEGEVESIDSILFDGVDYMTDGMPNFGGVEISERLGLPDQTHVPGIPASSQYQSVGVEITKEGGGYTKIIGEEDSEIDRVNLILSVNSLYLVDSKGNTKGTTVSMKISIAGKDEEFQEIPEHVFFNGKTMSPFQKMYTIGEIGIYGSPPWTIKIERDQDDRDSTEQIADRTNWVGYSEIIDEKLIYPNSAYVAFTVNAKNFGDKIPVRSFNGKWKKVSIPSNYNPITKVYTGIWDGTMSTSTSWTDNPAWIIYDILTDNRYGVGISSQHIDKFGLYTIGQHCDEIVVDGKGGFENRYTFNGVINSKTSIFELINQICSNAHIMPYWAGNQIQFTQDKKIEKPYSMVVSQANIIGEFQYSGTSLTNRTSIVNVSWNNPENHYEVDIETVEDIDGIERYGYNTKDVVAVGCTSQAQAHRYGKWMLYSELNQTSTINYTAGIDHIDVLPGDIIEINDPHKAGADFGGRLKKMGSELNLYNDDDIVIKDETIIKSIVVKDGHTYAYSFDIDGDYQTDLIPNVVNGHATGTFIASGINKNISFTAIGPSTTSFKNISIIDTDPNIITLDRDVEFKSGNIYYITCMLPDRTVEDRVIEMPYGVFSEVTIESAFSQDPIVNSMWVISGTDVATQIFKVISISDSEKGKFNITALQYDENKFKYIDDLPLLEKPEISRIPVGVIIPPTNLKVSEIKGVGDSGAIEVGAFISWKQSIDPRVFYNEVEIKKIEDGSEYYLVGETSGTFSQKTGLTNGDYIFRIRAVAPTGKSIYVESEIIHVSGINYPPTNPGELRSEELTDGVILSWDAIDDPMISGYEIRRGLEWDGDAEIITMDYKGTFLFIPLDNTNVNNFSIKSISIVGIYSEDASSIQVRVSTPNDISSFSVIKQDDTLLFSWGTVPGSGIEYEVRAGSSWGTSEMVLRASGTSASRLFPGDSTTSFLIKAVSGLGLYSDNPRFVNQDINLVQNRNLIINSDQKELGWPGNFQNMIVNASNEIEPQTIDRNYWGSYSFKLDIGFKAEARNWLDARVFSKSENSITWEEATFSWESEAAEASWIVEGDLDNVTLKKTIYIEDDRRESILDIPFEDSITPVIGSFTNQIGATSEYKQMRLINGKHFIAEDELIRYEPSQLLEDIVIKFNICLDSAASENISGTDQQIFSVYTATGETSLERAMEFYFWSNSNGILMAEAYNRKNDLNAILNLPESWSHCKNFTVSYRRSLNIGTVYIHCNELNEIESFIAPTSTVTGETHIEIARQLGATGFSLNGFLITEGAPSDEVMIDRAMQYHPNGFASAKELTVGDYNFQHAIVDIEIAAPSTSDPIAIWKCKHMTDVVDIVETGSMVDLPGDWTRINVEKRFNKIVDVFGQQRTGTIPAIFKTRNKEKDGFECILERVDNGLPLVGETIEWTARGY